MNQTENTQKRENWLKICPLIYSHLSVHPIPEFTQISVLKWLKGSSHNKSSFRYMDGLLCLGGYRCPPFRDRIEKKGVISLYNVSIPKPEELDDSRLRPLFQAKSELTFNSPVHIIQQLSFSHNFPNDYLAVALQKSYQVYIVPLKKLTSSDSSLFNHPINRQSNDISFLSGHQGPITQLKWGKLRNDKQTLFSSSLDSLIYQWDLEKLTIQRQMKFHRGHIIDLSVVHDSLKADKTDLWPQGPQISDNYSLASLSADGDVFLWDLRQKNPVNKISLKQGTLITSIESVSNQGMVTGSSDGKIQFWDLRLKTKYLYETKFDIKEGHRGKITSVKLNRQLTNTNAKNQKVGKINFTSTGVDGKIIQWQDKIQFVHEGHSTFHEKQKSGNKPIKCCYDRKEDCDLYASASNLENALMLWQPGVLLGNAEK